MSLIDEAATKVDQLARATGFERSSAAAFTTTTVLPYEVRVWTSSYAVVVAAATTAAEAVSQSRSLQAWLDEVLLSREREAKAVVDGYLILVSELELPPSIVQHLRLDRSVCRKYVVWPESTGERWARLEAVTVVGLPDRAGSIEEASSDAPPQLLVPLWRMLTDSASDADAIRQVCELKP